MDATKKAILIEHDCFFYCHNQIVFSWHCIKLKIDLSNTVKKWHIYEIHLTGAATNPWIRFESDDSFTKFEIVTNSEFENLELENLEFQNLELKIEKWKGFFRGGVRLENFFGTYLCRQSTLVLEVQP